MPTAVVTGANSGIGHALAKLLIEDGHEVYACDIKIGEAIRSLKAHVVELDLFNEDSIIELSNELAGRPIDVLFNVAGILRPREQDSLERVTPEILLDTFTTNAFGPLLLAQALLPNLLRASAPRIYNVGSRMGSVADNSTGGSYAYRSSKAALNSISKSMSVDLKEKGVTVLVLHPGTVRTNLVPGMRDSDVEGAVEPEVAARGLWDVCQSKGLKDTGTFWHRDGHELPW